MLLVVLQLERRDRMVSTNKPRWQSVPKAARTDAHKASVYSCNVSETLQCFWVRILEIQSPPGGGEDEAIPVDGFGQVQAVAASRREAKTSKTRTIARTCTSVTHSGINRAAASKTPARKHTWRDSAFFTVSASRGSNYQSYSTVQRHGTSAQGR